MDAANTTPLELLYERQDLPRFELPAALSERYGGGFGLARPRLYANFVTSLDGVVALAVPGDSGPVVSQNSDSDRFVMGLLRACADGILVGASTFRRATGHVFSAEAIHPASADAFRALRVSLGLAPVPRLVIVTRSGDLDGSLPALRDAWIATSASGVARLRARVPESTRVLVLDDAMRMTDLVTQLQHEQLTTLLTEGGPTLFSELVAARLIDELFLTSSPALFGRYANDGRKSLADGADLGGAKLDLLSARRQGSHMFMRYAFADH